MAESVGVNFVDESDFKKKKRQENPQWDVCSTVPSGINDSLAGISEF